jgi:ABC-type lipoprotein export system ATPase subunit
MQNVSNIVELINVRKSFGSTEVLKGVNLSVKPGDFISIRGKSGVGKTNLFKIMALLQPPDGGTVNIFGRDVSKLNDDKKTELRLNQMGLIFQFFNLLPSLTVLENIELPLSLKGVKKRERQERANELLAFFELTKLAERYLLNLSGGERQRVAIIRALVNDPAVLLADEPTSSLDDENSGFLLDLLGRISGERKVAVVLTSTDLYERLPTTKDYLLKDGVLLERSCGIKTSSSNSESNLILKAQHSL